MTDIIETEPCGRCGGSGQHSYCQMHGSTCFGCGGSGKTYTKRGKLVAAYVRELRKVAICDLKIGDRVKIEIDLGRLCKTTIKAVEHNEFGTTITTAGGKRATFGGGFFAQRILTGSFRDEVIAKATAYRDSLTLQGKPRKERTAA